MFMLLLMNISVHSSILFSGRMAAILDLEDILDLKNRPDYVFSCLSEIPQTEVVKIMRKT